VSTCVFPQVGVDRGIVKLAHFRLAPQSRSKLRLSQSFRFLGGEQHTRTPRILEVMRASNYMSYFVDDCHGNGNLVLNQLEMEILGRSG
jgi:hypothetical protein